MHIFGKKKLCLFSFYFEWLKAKTLKFYDVLCTIVIIINAMPDPGLGGINANVFPFFSIFDKMQQFFCIKLCICF